MIAALAAFQPVFRQRVEREVVSPVLQGYSCSGHHNAGTESHVVALYERDHVSLAVGGRKVDGAAA